MLRIVYHTEKIIVCNDGKQHSNYLNRNSRLFSLVYFLVYRSILSEKGKEVPTRRAVILFLLVTTVFCFVFRREDDLVVMPVIKEMLNVRIPLQIFRLKFMLLLYCTCTYWLSQDRDCLVYSIYTLLQ
jgi:hypothetical protein